MIASAGSFDLTPNCRLTTARNAHSQVCRLAPTAGGGGGGGVVTFEAVPKGGLLTDTADATVIKVTASLSGLSPNAKHTWHVHDFGDTPADTGGSLTGGHFVGVGVSPPRNEVGNIGGKGSSLSLHNVHVLTLTLALTLEARALLSLDVTPMY